MMKYLAVTLFALLVAGCATVPEDQPRPVSTAFPDYLDTSLGKLFEQAAVAHPSESAYFVPRKKGVEALQRLHERGVRVRVLTNSLASNDVIAAHAGYEKHRKQVVESGTELYELRPDAGVTKKSIVSHKSKAALHTKAMVFDGDAVFIGSLNLDPRSATINTEAGLYVESQALAKQVTAYMDEGVLPRNSYRVLVNEERNLVWVTEIDGREVRYQHDPETTFGERLISDIINRDD